MGTARALALALACCRHACAAGRATCGRPLGPATSHAATARELDELCGDGYHALQHSADSLCAGEVCDMGLAADRAACCEENQCQAFSSTFAHHPGYTVHNPRGMTVSELGLAAACAEGYAGTPLVSCPRDGGSFTMPTGCAPKATCGDADGAGTGSAAVACPAGLRPNLSASRASCAGSACDMTLEADQAACCLENSCSPFSTAFPSVPEGYTVAAPSAARASALGLGCAAGFGGTARIRCPVEHGAFESPSGCVRKPAEEGDGTAAWGGWGGLSVEAYGRGPQTEAERGWLLLGVGCGLCLALGLSLARACCARLWCCRLRKPPPPPEGEELLGGKKDK